MANLFNAQKEVKPEKVTIFFAELGPFEWLLLLRLLMAQPSFY